jgi:exodeoxyribonuclease VII large subunit
LLARGGGSIEDLWAFNDERVVRAVANSSVPIISGVGHETDFTLCDFAADLRAPTPTAAAELATPVTLFDLASRMSDLGQRAGMEITGFLERGRIDCSNIESRLAFYSPARRLQSERQRADEWARRLSGAPVHRLELEVSRLDGMKKRLETLNPFQVLSRGYAVITRRVDGTLVRSVDDVYEGDGLRLRVSDGELDSTVTGKKPRRNRG